MRRAVVDLDAKRILEVDGMRLVGECLQCGRCCMNRNCEHLVRDQVRPDGVLISRCAIQFSKPWACFLFPLPDSEVPVHCGYHYEAP